MSYVFGTHNYEHCVAVYNTRGYLDNVDDCDKLSMLSAIDEVKALPDYMQSGEVINCNVFLVLFQAIVFY